MAEIVIRSVETADFDRVGDIIVAAYSQQQLNLTSGGYVQTLRDTARRAAEAQVLVAECEGHLLGTVTYCPNGSAWREISADDEGEFRTLAVDPATQGRGVGRLLVAECVRRSIEAGHHAMVISSEAGQVKGHRLYELLGFARFPQRDWRPAPDVQLIAFRLMYS